METKRINELRISERFIKGAYLFSVCLFRELTPISWGRRGRGVTIVLPIVCALRQSCGGVATPIVSVGLPLVARCWSDES